MFSQEIPVSASPTYKAELPYPFLESISLTPQIKAARKWAKDFRMGRTPNQFLKDEFSVPVEVLRYEFEDLISEMFYVVPDGPEALAKPSPQQWTVTSSYIFMNPERVFEGKPIISPSGAFYRRDDDSTFNLPSLLELVFRQIHESGKALAAWSGPVPQLLFWDKILQGMAFTPEHARIWLNNLQRYFVLMGDMIRERERIAYADEIFTVLENLGIGGFWQELQSGRDLREEELDLLRDSLDPRVFFNAYDKQYVSIELNRRIRIMAELYLKLLEKAQDAKNDAELSLLKNPLPVLVPLRLPNKPAILLGHISEACVLQHGYPGMHNSDLEEAFLRRPPDSLYAWTNGINPDDLDPDRPIQIDHTASQEVFDRIREVLELWGINNMQVKRLAPEERSGFLSNCKLNYTENPFTYGNQIEATRNGQLVPVFDLSGRSSASIFDIRESLAVL